MQNRIALPAMLTIPVVAGLCYFAVPVLGLSQATATALTLGFVIYAGAVMTFIFVTASIWWWSLSSEERQRIRDEEKPEDRAI